MFRLLQNFGSKILNFRPLFQSVNAPKPYKMINDLNQDQLFNKIKIGTLLKVKHPKRSPKAHMSLFHGKQRKTGKQSCFSEKKTIRYWKINMIAQRHHYSEILGKKLRVHLSTAALKNMRKLGGFDNYILLSKPKDLDSVYGEYLRRLMIEKLNNPALEIPHLVKQRSQKVSTLKARQNRVTLKPQLLMPLDQRYVDQTHLKIKLPHQMNRQELAKYNELMEMNQNFQDVSVNHPLISEINDEIKREEELLQPEREKALKLLQNFKRKKDLEKIMKIVEEGKKEYFNPPLPKE